jgi:hypothetical protein
MHRTENALDGIGRDSSAVAVHDISRLLENLDVALLDSAIRSPGRAPCKGCKLAVAVETRCDFQCALNVTKGWRSHLPPPLIQSMIACAFHLGDLDKNNDGAGSVPADRILSIVRVSTCKIRWRSALVNKGAMLAASVGRVVV